MNAVYMQLKENKLFPPVVYCTLYIVECTIGTCIVVYIITYLGVWTVVVAGIQHLRVHYCKDENE